MKRQSSLQQLLQRSMDITFLCIKKWFQLVISLLSSLFEVSFLSQPGPVFITNGWHNFFPSVIIYFASLLFLRIPRPPRYIYGGVWGGAVHEQLSDHCVLGEKTFKA